MQHTSVVQTLALLGSNACVLPRARNKYACEFFVKHASIDIRFGSFLRPITIRHGAFQFITLLAYLYKDVLLNAAVNGDFLSYLFQPSRGRTDPHQ